VPPTGLPTEWLQREQGFGDSPAVASPDGTRITKKSRACELCKGTTLGPKGHKRPNDVESNAVQIMKIFVLHLGFDGRTIHTG
jgi:hypothetical protein